MSDTPFLSFYLFVSDLSGRKCQLVLDVVALCSLLLLHGFVGSILLLQVALVGFFYFLILIVDKVICHLDNGIVGAVELLLGFIGFLW